MEIALLLGMAAEGAPEPLRSRLSAVDVDAVAMLGQRDAGYRDEIGVATIAGRVWLRGADEVRRDPAGVARVAAGEVAAACEGWWLHVDLDVLDGSAFASCGAASDPAMGTGLSWAQLTAATTAALRAGGCRGWSVGVYNPDLDDDGRDAERIVGYLADIVSAVGGAGPDAR